MCRHPLSTAWLAQGAHSQLTTPEHQANGVPIGGKPPWNSPAFRMPAVGSWDWCSFKAFDRGRKSFRLSARPGSQSCCNYRQKGLTRHRHRRGPGGAGGVSQSMRLRLLIISVSMRISKQKQSPASRYSSVKYVTYTLFGNNLHSPRQELHVFWARSEKGRICQSRSE